LTPLHIVPPLVHNSGIKEYHWLFHRSAFVPDQQHHLSEHVHAMQITVLPGQKCLESSFTSSDHESARFVLSGSQCVIIVLDPLRLESRNIGGMTGMPGESLIDKQVWSQDEYVRLVHHLLELLTRKDSPGRVVAVCISKMDQVPARGTPWEILEQLFGAQMQQMLQYYRSRLSLEVCAATSFGEMQLGGPAAERLDPDQWQAWKPFNAAAPFFHLFQVKERAVVNGGPLSALLFGWWRTKQYLNYPVRSWNPSSGEEENRPV
jgi:hypothetical protein